MAAMAVPLSTPNPVVKYNWNRVMAIPTGYASFRRFLRERKVPDIVTPNCKKIAGIPAPDTGLL